MLKIKKIAAFIVYSNLWIALCASGFTLNTYLLLGEQVNELVISLVFFSTFSVYNLQRIVKHYYQKNNFSDRHQWIYKNKLIISFFVGITAIIALFLFFKVYTLLNFLLLLPFCLISVLYAFTLLPKNLALRDLPFLKVFIIAITWAASSVFLPSLQLDLLPDYKLLILFLSNFIYIVALTIPFDIRDLALDNEKTKTIPQVFGIKNSLYLSFGLLGICAILALFINKPYLIIPIGISFYFIKQTKQEKHELFYSGILDGTILLFPLVSYLFS